VRRREDLTRFMHQRVHEHVRDQQHQNRATKPQRSSHRSVFDCATSLPIL
jgi:hypothetical protein